MFSRYSDFTLAYAGVREIDYYLAKTIVDALDQTEDDLLFFSIVACSESLRDGHSCLQLSEWGDSRRWVSNERDETTSGYQFPSETDWSKHLSTLPISPSANHPIVYENGRLYLRRYWQFEDELAGLVKRYTHLIEFDTQRALDTLSLLFKAEAEIDWQKVSVANALGKQFSIVTGGPGTGKTTTVTKLLVALCEVFNAAFTIKMVAPTGKAAQRLTESIKKAKSALISNTGISPQALSSIPEEATTIHRLLGVLPNHYQFKYNQHHRLALDILLIDEASMVDLPLMTRLFRALPESARIIMLGDSNQLPSVAAGSVLADIAPVSHPGYSAENSRLIKALTGYSLPLASGHSVDYLTCLTKSYRFKHDGGIGRLAKEVIEGKSKSSWNQLLLSDDEVSLSKEADFDRWINQLVETYYLSLRKHNSVADAFSAFAKFRILAATRVGDKGVEAINQMINNSIKRAQGLPTHTPFYHGCPLLISENSYDCGLFNGDIGMVWRNGDRLQAAFPIGEEIRWFSLSRLPKHELVYAMTIHKTQGSEFEHVALVLPDHQTPILSRELIYTGVSRARTRLEVFSDQTIWHEGVERVVSRNSGLYDKLFLDSSQLTLL